MAGKHLKRKFSSDDEREGRNDSFRIVLPKDQLRIGSVSNRAPATEILKGFLSGKVKGSFKRLHEIETVKNLDPIINNEKVRMF